MLKYLVLVVKVTFFLFKKKKKRKKEKNFAKISVIYDDAAEYANLPTIPPFLQRSAEYINGVNFASGGAGVLSETNQGLVSQQGKKKFLKFKFMLLRSIRFHGFFCSAPAGLSAIILMIIEE